MIDLEPIKKRLAGVKEGPWDWECDDEEVVLGTKGSAFFDGFVLAVQRRCGACQGTDSRCLWPNEATEEYLKHSRTDIPAMIEEIERLVVEVSHLEEEIEYLNMDAAGGDI